MYSQIDEARRRTGKGPRRHFGPLVLLAGFWVGLLTACGYQLAGTGSLPGDVKRINVLMMVNRTAESGLETKVTNALIDEFTRRGQDVVTSIDRADGILSGSINSLSTQTVSRSGTITAVERRVVITASFILKDRNGKMLRQVRQLRAEQAYTVSDANRLRAVNDACQRLAESAYERLTDSF